MCTHDGVGPGDETLHLFTYYISMDEFQLRDYMVNWMKEHLYSVKRIDLIYFENERA